MQGHISKSSYTLKQWKEFLRTWATIGRAHVSSSCGPDLLQLLDIASTSLVADHDCDDCGPLCTAHLLPAGSTLCTPNSTAAIPASNPQQLAHLSLAVQTYVGKGRQALVKRVGLGETCLAAFASAAPAPSTGNTLLGSKPALDAAPTHNTSSTSGVRRVSKSP